MIFSRLKQLWKNENGIAAIEVSMILPVLLTILLGMVDMGHGMMVKKKVIGATQIVGDLLTRQSSVSNSDIADAIIAGQLAMAPYAVENFGVDIASIQYIGDQADPTILWRETFNMSPNDSATNYVNGMGGKGDGIMVITVEYTFEPMFAGFIMDEFVMRQVSFTRGRRSTLVRRE